MNSIRVTTMVFLASGLWAGVLTAHAETQAFKCTAEDGKISYLDTRPATGCVTIEVVRVNVGKGTPGENQATANTDTESSDKQGSDAKVDKEIAEKKASIKKDCETRKKDLETLKTKTFIQTKDADGKLHTLTPEELVERKSQIEDYVKTMCSE